MKELMRYLGGKVGLPDRMSVNLTLFCFYVPFLGSLLQLSVMPQTAGNDPHNVSNTSEMEISYMREKFLISVNTLVESKSCNNKVCSKENYF